MLLYSLTFFDPEGELVNPFRGLKDGAEGRPEAPVKCSLTPAPSAWYSRKEYLVTAPGPYRWILMA